MTATLVLGLRGAAAVLMLTVLAGGVPRVVSAALAVAVGLWSALAVAPLGVDATWPIAVHELAIGAAIGVVAAIPLLAAATAGRLVDLAATDRGGGPYAALFGVLAAAVFVGIDGHIAMIEAIVDSHRTLPAPGALLDRAGVVAAIGKLVPAAVRLALPWLITAAVVQIAAGAGTRLASRAAAHVPGAAAVPAALVMMTASLVATLAVAMATLVRGAI